MVTTIAKQVRAKSLELMVVAFGFAAGGVWKDAILEWMRPVMESGDGAVPLTIAAIVTTIVVVISIIALTKVLGEKEK